MTAPRRGLYAYAVVPGGTSLPGVTGVHGEPVEIIASGPAGLVISEVTTADLVVVTDSSADPQLVAALARQHDTVVLAAADAGGAVLPFRLGTILADRAAAHGLLAARSGTWLPDLRRVAGCREWTVTVRPPDAVPAPPAPVLPAQTPAVPAPQTSAVPAPQTDAVPAPPAPAVAAPQTGAVPAPANPETGATLTAVGRAGTPDPPADRTAGAGTSYLLRRRQMRDDLERARQARTRLASELDAALRAVAVDATGGGGDSGTLLNEVYLVRQADRARFVATVDRLGDRLAAEGFAVRVSGPWAPYSFAAVAMADGNRGTAGRHE